MHINTDVSSFARTMATHSPQNRVVPPKPPKLPAPNEQLPPPRMFALWQLQAPEVYVPRKPPFSYPTLNWKVLNGCCLVSMWFYNMCLKSNTFLWHHWEKLTTKQLVPSSVKELADPLKDSFDKDKPVKPVTTLKGAPPRSRRQLQLMAAMALLANATGAGRVFHTRAELQLKHKLRQFRACNGVLDTSRIHGTS